MARPRVELHRPERWDNPFSPEMTAEQVERLLAMPPFDEIDASKFPPTNSLADIVRNDTRIRDFAPGDIVVREADYGNSAFVILDGRVRVIQAPPLPAQALGRQPPRRRSPWQALAQLWTNPRTAERRDAARYRGDAQVRLTRAGEDEFRVTLADPDGVIARHRTAQMGPGEMFGEIAAVARGARAATVFAETRATLLEIRWQGLRDMRRRDARFRDKVDELYRKRALGAHMRESPLFKGLDDEPMKEVSRTTQFASFGEFDWHTSYKALAGKTAPERLEDEPIIVTEDQVADALIMVRSGFARVSERVDHGHRTVNYLGPGDVFGLAEIVYNWRNDAHITYQHTLRATGSVEVLRVPAQVIREHVLPGLPRALLPPPIIPRSGARSAWQADRVAEDIPPAMLEFLVDNRLINGTAAMVIDVDRCTRCDECVKACAATHDNNPRFVRHGLLFDHFMVANACMHCVDPVCMIGCPTGAIHRNVQAGQVVINDDTCIGCGSCANACPYNNIRLVDIRDDDGNFMLDEATNMPLEKATKCDLCADQIGGPACQRACPNDALVRINLRDLDRLAEWVGR
ncbi:MAG TPA: cyclic nucleotide-binding domain-containing protein [Alphaproteobacteria bacterium]